MSIAVTVQSRQRSVRVDRRGLAEFIRRLAHAKPPRGADRVGICLVSDRVMREYNRRYRGKDHATDVLAFPAGRRRDPEGGRHLGDIVISAPRAALQAREAGHAVSREVRILLLHAYLHLLGYDHEVDDGTMRRLERKLARRLLARRKGALR